MTFDLDAPSGGTDVKDCGVQMAESWPRGYKTFSCSTQLSIKFEMLINVKIV